MDRLLSMKEKRELCLLTFSLKHHPTQPLTVDNPLLQEVAGDILQKIIEQALTDNTGIVGKHPDAENWEPLTSEE